MKLDFTKLDGLVSVIAQDYDTNQILMFAFMNEDAWNLTQSTGIAHYYSRSRQKLWKKGESSGHTQQVKEILVDCDQDCLILKIVQTGAACHTGHKSCFYRKVENDSLIEIEKAIISPEDVY